jgi:hypothetical protein
MIPLMSRDSCHGSMALILAQLFLVALLAGCTPALQWRPATPPEKSVEYCETRGMDKQCRRVSEKAAQDFLDQISRHGL